MESESPRCPHRGLAPGELPFPEHHHSDDWLSSLQPRAGAVRLSAEQSAIVDAHMAFEDARVKCLQELARARLQDLQSLVRVRLQDLESLVREVERALRRMAAYASLQAPIHWLPTEVLAEIFKASLPENIEDLSFTPKTSPLVLAHVSRCWRQVAFLTPDLWLSVYINERNKAQCPSPHVLGEWLDRSASYPLTIKAILVKFDSYGLIPILFSKSQRWEDVELVSSQLDTAPIDNRLFPMLRSLRLETKKEADRRIHFTEENAPHLSKVFLQLIGTSFFLESSAAVLPYTQLTHYRGPAYREKTRCVLALMPGLQYGDLESDPFHAEGILPFSENILPSLSKLRIRGGRIELYQSIVAPALEHLVSSDNEREDAFFMVSCLVARSECRLKRLYITQSDFWPWDTNSFSFLFSPACEAVTELCIDMLLDVNTMTMLCHELNVRGKRVPSLPCLEKLYFRYKFSGDFDKAIIFNAVRSRCGNVEKQVCPLRHLCAPGWLFDERQVNDLVDMGLVIEEILPGWRFEHSLAEL